MTTLRRCGKPGVFPVIVHGGGKAVTEMEKTLGREASFVQGLRVTDADALELVQMVLAGKVNSDLVAMFNGHGIDAIGLTGADGQLLLASPRKKPAGLGYVGEVKKVNLDVFVVVADAQMVPVIAPLGTTEDGQLLNINADTVAGDIAQVFPAQHFLLLTDVPGVQDKSGEVLPVLTEARARQLIRNGTISGGMIPKVTACLDALKEVPTAHIVDGREPHAVLRQLLTDDRVRHPIPGQSLESRDEDRGSQNSFTLTGKVLPGKAEGRFHPVLAAAHPSSSPKRPPFRGQRKHAPKVFGRRRRKCSLSLGRGSGRGGFSASARALQKFSEGEWHCLPCTRYGVKGILPILCRSHRLHCAPAKDFSRECLCQEYPVPLRPLEQALGRYA